MNQEISPFVLAEAVGYIVRSDGSKIVAAMASPGEVAAHYYMKLEWERSHGKEKYEKNNN